MSDVYFRSVDFGGGGGGAGSLIIATRSDNGNPAVFTDIAARDAYTATADGTADAARINVTDANQAQEAFAVGTLNGSNQVTSITAAFIRLNGIWVAVATNLVGTPGTPGAPGQDGVADLTSVTNGRIPYNNAGTLENSPLRRLSNGNVFIQGIANIEAGTLALGPFIDISERGGFIGLTNGLDDEFTLVDYRTPQDAATSRPRILELTAGQANTVLQAIDTETLTSPVAFSYTPTTLSRVNAFIFQVGTAVTNLRFRIRDNADPTVILKYFPSEADWLDNTGVDFAQGQMFLNLGNSELPLSANRTLDIDVLFDSGSLLGDTNGFPTLTVVNQPGQFTDLAYLDDTFDYSDRYQEIDTDITIDTPNLNTYNRAFLAAPAINTGDITISIAAGVQLEGFDILNFSSHNVTITGLGGTTINGAASLVLNTQYQGGRLISEPNLANSFVFVYQTDTGSGTGTDNFVDSVDASVSGNDLTITLGRTGALADLSDTVTLPTGGSNDGVVDSIDASVSGNDLTITLGRTQGLASLSDTVTLPSTGSGSNDGVVDTSTMAVDANNIVSLTLGRTESLADLVTSFQLLAGSGITLTPDIVNRTITVALTGTPPPTQEEFYHGLSNTNTPATIDIGTLTQEDVGTGTGQQFTFASGTATQGQFLILLVPAAHDVSSIVNTGTNINETASFTRTANVRIIGGEQYNSYVLGALVAGFNANYRVTLA